MRKDVLQRALRYRSYWRGGGGITVSGGEPLLQIDFLLELFEEAKKQGIHTVIDTCGQPFTREEPFFSKFKALMTNTDLVLLDIKHIDSEQHRTLTGWGNENILDMARWLSSIGKPVWIRHVLVPQRNDSDEDLRRLDAFVRTLSNVERILKCCLTHAGGLQMERTGHSLSAGRHRSAHRGADRTCQ